MKNRIMIKKLIRAMKQKPRNTEGKIVKDVTPSYLKLVNDYPDPVLLGWQNGDIPPKRKKKTSVILFNDIQIDQIIDMHHHHILQKQLFPLTSRQISTCSPSRDQWHQ